MRHVIDAISEIARGKPDDDDGCDSEKDRVVLATQQFAGAAAARQRVEPVHHLEQEIRHEKQSLALNELLESSFAYVDQLIESNEIGEAIDFSKHLIDRFQTNLLVSGFDQIFNSRGTGWLETHIQQLTSAREFASLERSGREEKWHKQLAKLPTEIQVAISRCAHSSPEAGELLWQRIRERTHQWLVSIRSKDIDLDRFTEALGYRDYDFERLNTIESYFAEKLDAALALGKTMVEFGLGESAQSHVVEPTLHSRQSDGRIASEAGKLSLAFSEAQRLATEKILFALANQDLSQLKQLLTGFKGTASDFNTIGRAIEELLTPFGINVTGAFGPHWAFINLESPDYEHGIQVCMPSGKITGHAKGTAYCSECVAEALAALAKLLTRSSTIHLLQQHHGDHVRPAEH